jgi:hypothetical protein
MPDENKQDLIAIDVVKDFKYAYRGCDVHSYQKGERSVAVPAECAELAISEGWAVKATQGAPKTAAMPAAPQNQAGGVFGFFSDLKRSVLGEAPTNTDAGSSTGQKGE